MPNGPFGQCPRGRMARTRPIKPQADIDDVTSATRARDSFLPGVNQFTDVRTRRR
jgi:hypothetical protein